MVLAVLTLPLQAAAITLPLGAATRRRPVTANSRVRTIISAQAGNRPHSVNMVMTAMVSSLSARGSRNLPKSVTWLQRRAIWPSRKSLRLPKMKIPRLTHIHRDRKPSLI